MAGRSILSTLWHGMGCHAMATRFDKSNVRAKVRTAAHQVWRNARVKKSLVRYQQPRGEHEGRSAVIQTERRACMRHSIDWHKSLFETLMRHDMHLMVRMMIDKSML